MTSAGGFNFFQQVFFVAKAKRQLQAFENLLKEVKTPFFF